MEIFSHLIELAMQLVDFVLHIDLHLVQLMNQFGSWLYLIAFLIVFCETGLVVTPFLPGDSLLFALGALTAIEGSPLDLLPLIFILIVAGVLGDAVNYSVGRFLGPRVFTSQDSRLLNKQHLIRTQKFYDQHGPVTIIIARFMPIVRTFAPFVAGIGQMNYSKFGIYNITGAIVWVVSFCVLGHFFGNLPIVKKNFTLLIFAIIFLSVLPMIIGLYRDWKEKRRALRA